MLTNEDCLGFGLTSTCHIIFMTLITGERGLEVCSNGVGSTVPMDLHTSRPSGNSWYHSAGTNTL
jgi:hypothetical protein